MYGRPDRPGAGLSSIPNATTIIDRWEARSNLASDRGYLTRPGGMVILAFELALSTGALASGHTTARSDMANALELALAASV